MSQITVRLQQIDANGNVVDVPLINGYTAANKEESMNGTSYYGFVNSTGNWYIQRITATDIDFAKGLTDYATSWAGRAGLTYVRYDIVF